MMMDKTSTNDSLEISFNESDWITSTPTSRCHYEKKFYSAFEETPEYEYSSALSNFYTDYKSFSAFKGSSSAANADEEVSSPNLFVDDEKEEHDREKYIDFDGHNLAFKKDISLNIEDFDKNCVYNTNYDKFFLAFKEKGSSNAADSQLSSPDLFVDPETERDGGNGKNIDFEERNSAQKKDIFLINEDFIENDIDTKSSEREKVLSDDKPAFQNFPIQEHLLPEETNEEKKYLRSTNDQTVKIFAKECAFKEDESNDKFYYKTLRSQRNSMRLNISDIQRDALQISHISSRSCPLNVSNRFLCKNPNEIFQPESLKQLAAKAWKPFDSEVFDWNSFVTGNEKGGIQDAFESRTLKSNLSCLFPENDDLMENGAEAQHDPATDGKEFVRDNNVTMRGNDILSSKENDLKINETRKEHCPSVETILDLFSTDNILSKNILLAILSRNPTKGASYIEIIKYLKNKRVFRTKLNACVKVFLKTAVEANIMTMNRNRYVLVSRVDGTASQFTETDEDRKPQKERQVLSRKSKPSIEEKFSESTHNNNNMEKNNEGKNSERTKEYHICVNKIVGLFNSDSNLSKNILLAILNENFTEGTTYSKIVKYLRYKNCFSTKLSECVRKFLLTAVNANILKVKRRRYFLVSKDVAQMNCLFVDEQNRKSNKGFSKRRSLPSRTKSKL